MTSSARTTPSWFPLSVTQLWPGLARLWLRGEWRGLLTAGAFALVVNFALITTFVWPQLVSRQLPAWAVPSIAWIVVVWLWVAGLRAGGQVAATLARESLPLDAESTKLFCQAQLEYLKGHWLEAETGLTMLLARSPGDVEAWLLLASVQRRTKRPAEARRSLAQLAELSGSAAWGEEVQREILKIQALEVQPLSKAA